MKRHFLTTQEAAELLRRSVVTVQRQAHAGRLPHVRRGGTRRLLFVPAEIESYMAGAELERLELPDGGRIVRVKEGATA